MVYNTIRCNVMETHENVEELITRAKNSADLWEKTSTVCGVMSYISFVVITCLALVVLTRYPVQARICLGMVASFPVSILFSKSWHYASEKVDSRRDLVRRINSTRSR